MDHFAQLFVFNGLTPFSFRMESQAIPAHRKGEPALPISSEKQ